MKILKIDHIGIAVENMNQAKSFWTDILGLHHEGSETVAEQKVTTAFLPVGESEMELLESTSPDGPVAKFIEKRGPGFQHVAFRVADIEEALAELKGKGIRLIDEKPRKGAGGAKIIFLNPKDTGVSLWSSVSEYGLRHLGGPLLEGWKAICSDVRAL